MAFAIGLLLAPLGGLLGALMIAALVAIVDAGAFPRDFLLMLPWFGATLGALFAAPTTLVTLPLAHHCLRRKPGGHTVALAAAGAASGALTMCLFAVAVRDAHEPVLQARAIVIALVGGFAGGACGLMLGAALRKLGRPSGANAP